MAINLTALNEVIAARKDLHGGTVGAPVKLEDGSKQGLALNKACVVLLSSTLQAFVEEVFLDCSNKAFGKNLAGDELKNYRATWSRWGNPSDKNITALFRRLGVDDVFTGLSWQGQGTPALKKNLDRINQVRNKIAHGSAITVDGSPFPLHLYQIEKWRNIADTFGGKFPGHAMDKIK